MKTKTKGKASIQVDDILSTIPSYVKTPTGIFNNLEHYRVVASKVTRALATNRKTKNSRAVSGSILFTGIRVEFSIQQKEEEIFLDNFESKIVLLAPKKKHEPESSLLARRMYYLGELTRSAESMKVAAVSHIYLALKPEGRRKISKGSIKTRSSK